MLSLVIKAFFGLLALSSYKYIPFAYLFRLWSIPLHYLYFKKSDNSISPFTICNRKTYCCPLECDFFGFHKTNSSYFVELDLARIETVLNALLPWFHRQKTTPYVPLAEINNIFLKEIKPFQNYNVLSRIVALGEKWCYVLSLFVIKAPNNHSGFSINYEGVNYRVCAISVGKLVFKAGRKSIVVYETIDKSLQKKARDNEALVQAALSQPQQLIDLFNSL